MRAKDQVVIVTGAASGVGAATAKLFAREGARVLATDVAPMDEVVGEIESSGGTAKGIQADLAEPGSALHIVDRAVSHFGRVDVLIGNAATDIAGTVETATEADFDRAWAVNFKAGVLLARAVLPHMRRVKGGVILFTTALAGHHAVPNLTPYTTSKAALISLVRCMALDYGREGIRVNSVSPGPIDTPMMRRARAVFNADVEERFAEMMPTGRVTLPEEIAEAFMYLASPAARSINGATLMVDGGIFAGQFQPRSVR